MASTNPFTVLGFVQSAFTGMSDIHIRKLVKSQYLALASIHHPDIGGKVEKFKAVQEAHGQLEEDHEFDFHKKMFMRRRKDHISELAKENRQMTVESQSLHRGLVDFWLAYCRGQNILQNHSLVTGELARSMMGLEGFSIFDPPPISVIMTDRLKDAMQRRQVNVRRREINVHAKNFNSFDSDCFDFRISPDGVMTRQVLVKTYFDGREKWRPPVRKELVELSAYKPSKSYYWKAEGEREVIPGTLIGSFPTKVVSDNKAGQNSEATPLIPTTVSYEDYKILERGYSLDEFSPYLQFVRPYVTSSHLVIFAEGDDEKIRFKIIGYARKILLDSEEEVSQP